MKTKTIEKKEIQIAPVGGEILRLIPFAPTKRRTAGLKQILYTSQWGKVSIMGRESMNAFDLKVFMAFSYLLSEKIQAKETYDAGENIYRWQEQNGKTQERKVPLVGITTSASNFLTNCMHLSRYKANMDAVWESFLRYEGTIWVFETKKEKITAKIIHGILQKSEGWTILVSGKYAQRLQQNMQILGVANDIVQNTKNDAATLLSCWLQGQKGNVFFLPTIAENIRVPKNKYMAERIRKAFNELCKIGQVENFEIEKNGKSAEKWKIKFSQNKRIINDIKAKMIIARKRRG